MKDVHTYTRYVHIKMNGKTFMKQYIETNVTESTKYSGYYHTEVSSEVVISPLGKAISLLTKRIIEPTYGDKRQYPSIRVTTTAAETVHRVLAMAFLKCPGEFKDYHVNHKNGIKSDFSLNNLEWVTPTENIVHAYESGLRTDNRPTLVKDLETGKIKEFYGQNECARYLDTTSSHIRHWLRTKVKKFPFDERWDIKRVGDEWNAFTRADVGNRPLPSLARIITVTKDWKLVTLFENIAHVADHYGVTLEKAKQWLECGKGDGEELLNVFLASKFRLKEEHAKYLKNIVKKTYVNKSKKKKRTYIKNLPTPVIVTNTKTGEKVNYLSVDTFSKTVDVMRKTIQRSVWKNGGRWRHWHIEYVSKEK